MKKSKTLLLTMTLTLGLQTFAVFKSGELIELSAALNARTSMNFYKSAKNIETTLPKGTHGIVEESVELQSGNFGVKIKLPKSHPDENEKSYWVYYNKKNPNMKLFDLKKNETDDIDEAIELTTIKDIDALRDQSQIIAVNLISQTKSEIDEALRLRIAECERLEKEKLAKQKRQDQKTNEPVKAFKLSMTKELNTSPAHLHSIEMDSYPFREKLESDLKTQACRTNEAGIDYCAITMPDGNRELSEFSITNKGGNSVVKTSGEAHINRKFGFSFEGLARSDMHLMVVDSPDDYTSNSTYNMLMFFPRTKLPSIKTVGDEHHVTLPTGEQVVFDKNTGIIKSGVLKEKPMEQLPVRAGCDYSQKACGRKAVGNVVDYQGEGVVIKIHKSGDLPMGDREVAGKPVKNPDIAVIQKKGQTCKIPVADLWYTDYKKGGQVLFKPEYSTDEAFDQVLKKKCGFSMI